MAQITTTQLANGLPLHRIAVEGTRSVTLLVAFDAGARTERPEENGMAHFLEHLVFKGGEKYPTYRDVNEAAERNGAVLNAYTSHDLVAFHITARATRALEAADLLTDFVARPRIDPEELDRERGVVVQEIARANDQPSMLAEHLIDEAVFGDHPLGRPVLGTTEHLSETFTRDGILAFRAAAGRRRAAPHSPSATSRRSRRRRARRAVRAVPGGRGPGAVRARAGARAAGAGHRARLQPVAPADVLPPAGRRRLDPRQRAALAIYSTLLGGSMGSRLFDEIREQRGLAYSVSAFPHAYADVPRPTAERRAWTRPSASRPTGGCGTSSRSCASRARPRPRSSAPAHTPPAPARSPSRTPARSRATPHSRRSSTTRTSTPTPSIELLDAVTFDEVREIASGVADDPVIACVGPHTVGELEAA